MAYSITQVNTEFYAKSCISVLHCNIRSLNRNKDLLCAFLAQHYFSYDIIALSETWLKRSEHIPFSGYHCVSNPRQTSSRGGGVALYIRQELTLTEMPELLISNNNIESLFITISTGMVIGVVYRPPSSISKSFYDVMETILSALNDRNYNSVIITGDFNIDTYGDLNTDYSLLLQSYNYKNTIFEPTRITTTSATIIDHILCNHSNILAGVYNTSITDHSPVFAFIPKEGNVTSNKSHPRIGRINYSLLREKIEKINFSDILKADNNTECDKLVNTLSTVISECTRNYRRHEQPLCPWMTKAILSAIKEKDTWYQKWKKQRQNVYYLQQYRSSRNSVVAIIRKRKKEYNTRLIHKAQGNSKKMWNIINNVIGAPAKRHIAPDRIDSENVDVFNIYFTNIGPALADCIPHGSCDVDYPVVRSTFCLKPIEDTTVQNILTDMNANKAAGHDGITVKSLKDNVDLLCPVLTTIFNRNIERGTYPETLKIAKVSPIYKCGDINDPGSYRPISVLSVINTVFEKVISIQLKEYLSSNNILNESQHGFRTCRSTSSAVLELSQSICESLHKNELALVIFLDLKKAFDTVIHSILLKKLETHGFSGSTLNLFSSYLNNRQQFVKINNFTSSYSSVKTGVPQGSVLGPILFSLYINDFPSVLTSAKAVMYADDTALVYTGQALHEVMYMANTELTRVSSWFGANKLTLNKAKTNYMLFHSRHIHVNSASLQIYLDNSTLEQVNTIKYLGVTLDSSLNWKPHIDNLCSKLASACYGLLKARACFDISVLKIIYFSIFHCHITYCCESWSSTFKTYLDPVVRLQKRAVRIITFSDPFESSSPLFCRLKILPFTLSSEMKVAILVNNIIFCNHSLSSSMFVIPTRNTRNATNINFNLPITRNTYGQRLIQYYGTKIWNALPIEVKTASNFMFSIKKLYLSKII